MNGKSGLEKMKEENPVLFQQLMLWFQQPPRYGDIVIHFENGKLTFIQAVDVRR